ncbi:hypothetical protein PIB30_065626 [Stylosanthes scabra]|uniref:Uncharacterized protein n=1 Tax=Stylosanthes scabra TaxID=79078 RepID=A0ABU6XMY2_9FABA|nr:hypothetical protein [Stylosanthes scabra]
MREQEQELNLMSYDRVECNLRDSDELLLVDRDLASETNDTLENGPFMHNMNATKADKWKSTSRFGGSEQCKDNTQTGAHVKDKKSVGEHVCLQCLRGGELLCCFGKGCQRRYHPSCLNPPLNYYPVGFWNCAWCVKKKLVLGVYSISEGVESILDTREGIINNVTEKEYFVKYLGLAHAHNRWILETQMLLEAPKVLSKFKRMPKVIKWKREWSIPHRLLLKRAIVLPKKNEERLDGHDNNDSVSCFEWLVKWSGLGYDHITWELDSAFFFTSSEGMKLKKDYVSRRKGMGGLPNSSDSKEERKASFAELSVPPSGDSPVVPNQHLSYVNKLCTCWHKGQSAVVVDDKIDQERVMKLISFILSLHCKVTRPFLIISTSSALAVWEREFSHLAPSANLVIYKGNKDVRRSIRTLEFYNDDNGILFQILLSSSDIVVEDLNELQCISWEAIIIDECQRPRMLEHLDIIKILTTVLRILVVSAQIKEDRADYIKLLSFLKSGSHVLNTTETEPYVSDSISNLKTKFDQYVAFRSKIWSPKFAEFWVPAKLSNLQLEQYCSLLLSDRTLLCSAQKSDKVNALHGLLKSIRKCCNHPFLVDRSLYDSVNKGLSIEEQLNIGIKASGKLQLLENLLLKARSRGFRVMILFQSTSDSTSIGDILDDVLCRRFGEDCYVRYAAGYAPKVKQSALDRFNDGEKGTFVFLLESRACLPSVKLSSVDAIILFDSDCDPENDLRALQRMPISSQFEQLVVFRLYSSFTVEEKVLMLAKEGSSIQLINHNTSHALLRWGITCLFNSLDDLHGSNTSVVAQDIASDQSFLHDVISELSVILACGSGDIDHHGLSFIARVQQKGGEYARNILLHGEKVLKKLGDGFDVFSWSNLLQGKSPRWKFLSVPSQRIRKPVNHFDPKPKESENENDADIRKKRKVPENKVDTKRKEVSKDTTVTKKGKVPDHANSKYSKKSSKNKKLNTCITDELLPKPDLTVLCDVLQLPENIKAVGARLLEFILKEFNVNCPDDSTMQAFELSVCWLAASLLKHKFDKQGSLALAKVHLNFNCEEEEVTNVYSKLLNFKEKFSSFLQSGICVEKCTSDCEAPDGLTDLVEHMQNGFPGPHVSDPVESDTYRQDLERESPTTVLATHYQAYAENFQIRPTDIDSCPQKSSGTFPVEAEAIPMKSKASFLEHQSGVINSSDDPHNVNPAPGSLGNPINGNDSEVPLINTNEVVETSARRTADVREANQRYSVVSAVHGESIMNLAGITLPHTDLPPSPLVDVPSFVENISIAEVLASDENFGEHFNLNIPDGEPTLQAPDDLDESVPDSLQTEMERIIKETEEAKKIRDQKLLQLESDHGNEVQELVAKYQTLLRNISTEFAHQKKELNTYYKTVSLNMLLAEVLDNNNEECIREAVLFGEQGLPFATGTPSSSSTQLRENHPPFMPDQGLEQHLPIIPPRLFTPSKVVNALEMVNTSTAIPDGECIDPMIQSLLNFNYDCDSMASDPPLGASSSVPIMPDPSSGTPEQELPIHLYLNDNVSNS